LYAAVAIIRMEPFQPGGEAMPFVHIDWLEGRDQSCKDEVARRVCDVISELTGLPKDAIWIVFEDVRASDWYVGSDSVQALRARPKQSG
jgi:4-oxalocrotonate tautomerase